MKYRAFGDFRKGHAHVKNGSGVEDYAGSYNDPEGRFHIGVICDGHSDKNCFRSGKGARFGCESALEILKRFFELYLAQNAESRTLPDGFESRLKKSLKLCWDRKVYNDIKENPLVEDELMPLTDRVRKIYEAGNGLLNIYGATFLAIGICEDFFIALHIGDGAILCIDEDGSYYSPVPQDSKSETGAPASLCDADLFSRENAFRVRVSKKLPQLATVSSDGIEDCMDSFEYKRFTCSLFKKMELEEEEGQECGELNEKQMRYFGSCLEYYADKGHGAEDDCSLAAIYDLTRSVPEVRIPNEEAIKLWERTLQERNDVVRDYENRKNGLLESMAQVYNSTSFEGGTGVNMDQWMEAREKFEEQKRTLKTIVTNENEKIVFYERQLTFYSQYIDGFSEETGVSKKLQPQQVDDVLMVADEKFAKLKLYRQDYQKKMAVYKQLKNDLEVTARAIDDAYDEAKRLAKLDRADADTTDDLIRSAREKHQVTKVDYEKAAQEYESAKGIYEKAKTEYFRNQTSASLDFCFPNRQGHPLSGRQVQNPFNNNPNASGSGPSGTGTRRKDATRRDDTTQLSRKNGRDNKQQSSESDDTYHRSGRLHIDIGPWFW